MMTDQGLLHQKFSALEQIVAKIWEEVLGCSITSGYDNFFLLGGDSISGVKIIARINARFGTNLSMHQLFDQPEFRSFSRQIKALRGPLDKREKKEDPPPVPLGNYFPLLPNQELIWLFETVNPGTSVYHIPLVYRVSGDLNLKVFEKTLNTISQYHPALTTTFSMKDDQPIQHRGEALPEFVINTEEDLDQEIWLEQQVSKPFDLAHGPLFRTAVLKSGSNEYLVCFTIHHLVFDGWSAALFMETLNQVYGQLINNAPLDLPLQGHGFHEHVVRENRLAPGRWEAARPFFSIYFSDLPSLPVSPTIDTQFTASTCPVNLDKGLYQKVRQTARDHGTTPFVVLLSIFQLILSVKSGQDNQITGIAYASRNRVEAEPVVGFFMTTLVVKNIIPFHTSFANFLDQMKKTLDTLFKYKDIPFHTLQEFCRDQGLYDQIISTLFLMQTMDSPELSLEGIETEYIHCTSHETNTDLTLELYETPIGANGWFKYKTNLFTPEEAGQMAAQFQQISSLVLDRSEDELETLLADFSVHPRETENLKSRAEDILGKAHFPLSPMQHGMLMETLRAPQGAGCYVEQVVFTMGREIDPSRFASAWDTIISHHQSLRLGFKWKGLDSPEQYLVQPTPLRIEYNDWSDFGKPEQQEYINMFLKADRRLGFSLDNPPAYRVALVKTAPKQFTCIWSFHHCIGDGRSMGFILRDLFQAYEAPGIPLKPAGSFQHFIAWLYSRKRRAAKQFWRRYLAGFDEPMVFPFRMEEEGDAKSQRQTHAMSLTTGHHHVNLSPITARQIKRMCQDNQLTMNAFLMGAWAILLSHYTGKTDILFGTTASVRHFKADQEDSTGLYINTLPVRINVQPNQTLVNYIQDIRDRWRRIRAHDHFSLTDIHALSPIQGSHPLSEIYFSYDYQTLDTALTPYKSSLACSEVRLLERTPAAIFLTAQGVDNLTISIEYDQRKFNARTTRQILDHFTCFLKSASDNPRACLRDLPVLTSTETALIEEKLNTRQGHLPPRTCFHSLFEIQASINQSAPAVTDGKTSYTYGQLNLFANQIAHCLIAEGAGPEKKVLLLLDQNTDLIAVLLGVLKSGACYIPMDVSYPMDRIHYIMEDADPDLIITTLAHKDKLPETETPNGPPNGPPTIFMDQDKTHIQAMPSTNPVPHVTPENMAYIIYTSGSTGHPKGVVIEHGSLASFTKTASDTYDLVPTDQVLQFASISFDASAEEIYPTLFSGACLVIKPRSLVHTPEQFFDYCRENQLTVVDLPTAYWHLIADQIITLNPPEQLRLMIIGGDAAHPDKVRKWQDTMGDKIRLLNTYGPTETTVAVTYADLSQMPVETAQVPIGIPFSTVNLCILNHFHQPAPPGVTGELFIGGPQVARGYLNRDKKTKNTFVPIGFLGNQDRFFKTNDHAKMLPSGQILFLGRIDRQIKIRGFRVEPGEIEKTALLHDQIKECALAVSTTAAGNTRLTAFVVFEEDPGGTGLEDKPFKEWMRSRLPEYMVPSALVPMGNLPYTPSGKIDYKALDKAVQHPTARKQQTDHQALTRIQDHYETGLAQIWKKILGANGFGSADNFFDVGGSSLTAIRLVTAIENQFHVALPVLAVFQFPILQDLAHVLRQKDKSIHFSSVKTIKGEGSQTPIFFVAGTEENTQAFKKQDLRGHPFYTITVFAHKTRGRQIIPMDVWEIARRNVREILQAQSAGPYIIIGFCRYSLVAYEIAAQLISMGKSVEQLIFLDEFWQKKGNEPKGDLGKQIRNLIPKTKQALRSYAHSLNKKQGKFYKAIGKPLPETLQARLMESSFWKAYESYIPLPYPGDAIVLDSLHWTKKSTPGLRAYIQGNLKTIEVSALHSNWFDPSQIKTILSSIDTVIETTSPGRT